MSAAAVQPLNVVTYEAIVAGLHGLGLTAASTVIVHASLRSFGWVDGGAVTVCRALLETCGTVVLPAASWDLTGIPAPPGLVRPHNAVGVADNWAAFDAALAQSRPFALDLPIDRELGHIPETMRQTFPHHRSAHPLLSYLAVGRHAERVVQAQRLDWPLGPIEEVARLGGDVLLLGVDHTVNTTIHLAEQRLGRSRFYRYAKVADQVWMELPNIPGQSHRFDDIAPALVQATRETLIGASRVRRIAVTEVLVLAERLIEADATALLCDDADDRCGAAVQQRLAWLAQTP